MNKLLKASVLVSEISAPSINSTEQESHREPELAGNMSAFSSV